MKRSRRNYTSPTVRREYYVNGRRFRSMATAKRHAVKLAKRTSSDVEIEGYDGRGYKVSSEMIGPPGVPAWAKGIEANPQTRAKTLRADKWIRLPAGATHVKVSRTGKVQAGVSGARQRKANPKCRTNKAHRSARRRKNPATHMLRGAQAIEYARKHGLKLSKYADPTERALKSISLEKALRVAREDPSLIYLRVRVGKKGSRVKVNPRLKRNPKPTKKEWLIAFNGSHQGTVYASTKAAALRQAKKKWGNGPYTAVQDR